MTKTVISTTTIQSPDHEISYGLSKCPVSPQSLINVSGICSSMSWGVGLTLSNGDRIYWDEDMIRKHSGNDNVVTWFKAPTISDAVNSKLTGTYYQFYANGSIEVKYEMDERKYYWSEEVDSVEEEGAIIWNHFNEDKQEYEENEEPVPCKICKSDCRGSNYEDCLICSSECLNKN